MDHKINIVTMENVKEIYPWADYIDQAIINIIINSSRSMAISTLKNKFFKEIEFETRLGKIIREMPHFKLWEQKKPTPQIGTEKQYREYINSEKEVQE